MPGIKDFLNDSSPATSVGFMQPESGKQTPGSNYVALGLVERGLMPDIGGNYIAPGAAGPGATLTEANIVATIKSLAFLGRAVFFGDGLINGAKGMPKPFEESNMYGSRTQKRETGRVTDKVDFEFSGMFLNVAFFNALRSRVKVYDAFLFTPGSVQIVRYDANSATYHDIGHKIEKDVTKDISGGFSLSWNAQGELVPFLGIPASELSSETMRYTFGAYGTTTGMVPVAGQPDRFTLATATAGSVTRVVVETGQVSYQILKNVSDPIPVGENVTVNAITGKVDIATGGPLGRRVYTVIATNTTGVFGRYTFTVDVTA